MCLYVFHLFYRVREKPVIIFVCLNNIFLQCVPSYYFVIPFGDLKKKQNKYLSLISSIETEHGKISKLLSIHIHFLYTDKNVGSKSGFVRRLSIGHSNIWEWKAKSSTVSHGFFSRLRQRANGGCDRSAEDAQSSYLKWNGGPCWLTIFILTITSKQIH